MAENIVLVPEQAQTAPETSTEGIIRAVAVKYGLNEQYFLGVAQCESNLNPSSVNYGYYAGGGNPSGLFQFLPETWARISARAGISGDVFNAKDNAEVAGWAFANGYSGEWACA